MNSVVMLLSALPWFAWIAIVAIISGTIDGVFKRTIKHRERMAMIQHGIHPDAPAEKIHAYADAEV